jgi:hypothetical protein
MTLEYYRRFYAEEIGYSANVQSPALLAAFARVPRETPTHAIFITMCRRRSTPRAI